MARSLLVPLLFLLVTASAARAEAVTTPGEVTAVTVFQGQALVTRLVELPAEGGLVEVVVTDLPERLLPGSLYAEPGSGVEVRSVRTRLRPASEAPREEVKELEERLAELGRQKRALTRERGLLQQREVYLTRLEGFTSGTATEELKSGVLNADTLRELTEMIFTERAEAAHRELEILTEEEEIDAQLRLAQRELATLTGGSEKSTREAVVFVSKEAGASDVRLMYLVGGASWSPSYNVRAKEDRSGVTLEYNASVTQMSGEDWTDVEMTLSTATPSLVATSPKLDPLTVRLASFETRTATDRLSRSQVALEQKALASNRGNFVQIENAWSDLAEAASAPTPNSPAGGLGGGFGAVYAGDAVGKIDLKLNSFACAVQLFDLQAGDASQPKLSAADDSSEGLSVVYRLPNKTSLPSRDDKQLIQIAALPLEAEFYRVATPVLTSYVYQEAKLSNATDHVLLAGPAATFLGDRFVGRGEIPQAAIGESFTVGLGIDESLRATRELVDKTDRIQGGNRVVTIEYRLAIENFGDDATPVRVMDRLPKSDRDAIKVTLVESDPRPVDETDEGLLRWDVEAPAGDEAAVKYSMTIEHDKNLRIVGSEQT